MTRKALNAFKPETLKLGVGRGFEVRHPITKFKEFHYFFRDYDGEVFKVVCHNMNEAVTLRNEWRNKKRDAAMRAMVKGAR